MKILIVYSHPYDGSFNNAVKEKVVLTLKETGHSVELRDLYSINFNPVLSASELVSLKNGKIFDDVKEEQEFVSWADIMVFIYPIWWGGMPAIARGYLDRVFSYGYAYLDTDQGPVGLLNKKRIILINTVGATEELYRDNGMKKALEIVADIGVFQFCDAKVEKHIHLSGIPTSTLEDRKSMLADIESFFKKLK